MGDTKRFRSYVLHALIGAIGGFLIFHPYTMVIHAVTGRMHGDFSVKSLLSAAKESLSPEMWLMASAFALSCAWIGILTAAMSERKRRLYEAELDSERQRTAIATLQRLMITLSHYLLNANTVIGGMARRAKKHTTDGQADEFLDLIIKEATRIDEVIAALKRITEFRTADYTSEGRDLMIDIADDLEKALGRQQDGRDIREG